MKHDFFFCCLSNKMAFFKGDKWKGDTQSKVHVILFLTVNQKGTEKLPPAMICHSIKPRCLSFLFVFKSNRKSWITHKIFSKWLKEVDKSMELKKTILLFIDNSSSHKNLPTTKNLTVEFLSLNTILKLQPL